MANIMTNKQWKTNNVPKTTLNLKTNNDPKTTLDLA